MFGPLIVVFVLVLLNDRVDEITYSVQMQDKKMSKLIFWSYGEETRQPSVTIVRCRGLVVVPSITLCLESSTITHFTPFYTQL